MTSASICGWAISSPANISRPESPVLLGLDMISPWSKSRRLSPPVSSRPGRCQAALLTQQLRVRSGLSESVGLQGNLAGALDASGAGLHRHLVRMLLTVGG